MVMTKQKATLQLQNSLDIAEFFFSLHKVLSPVYQMFLTLNLKKGVSTATRMTVFQYLG